MSSSDSGDSMGAAAAIPVITQAISKIGGALLAAHTARLKGATSENAAIPQCVQAFDLDIADIVNAYNSGNISAAQGIAALQKVDAGIVAYLKQQVGKPGTAWSDTFGMQGKCDKTCTAGCCVYFGALGPVISGLEIAMGGQGRWGTNDPRLSMTSTGVTVQAPTVNASKYGGINRPGYTINIVRRPSTTLNPPQYSQTGMPTIPPAWGNVSEGSPIGQTPSFSNQAQGLLTNAGLMQNPFTTPVMGAQGSTGVLLLGLGIVTAVVIALVARR